ncbi:hypothetical protein GQ55_3G452900 [Panicum hallii var. hallii]|uniref:Uncharacterized protein n=1 Tax=Panicum hallii var. hallii TaxID=1504633 RepID=A0A2T7EIK8_9POAL|nr:hypothetical protein GQ55_3G452900 [Panicum hallii var. hallii]
MEREAPPNNNNKTRRSLWLELDGARDQRKVATLPHSETRGKHGGGVGGRPDGLAPKAAATRPWRAHARCSTCCSRGNINFVRLSSR